MKVIFLDFDGVLNSSAYYERCGGQPRLVLAGQCPPEVGDRWAEIDPEAVAVLNQIVAATGAQVVISSTWRLGFKYIADIRAGLRARGFVGDVIGATPIHPDGYRGREILDWLNASRDPNASICVLDDDSDMDGVRDWFLKIDAARGLQPEHVEQAVAILNRPRPTQTLLMPGSTPGGAPQ